MNMESSPLDDAAVRDTELFENEELSDCTVKASNGNREWKLHSNILVPRNKYFAAALSGRWQEGRTREITVWESFDPGHLHIVFKYIYQRSFRLPDNMPVGEFYTASAAIYQAADYFQHWRRGLTHSRGDRERMEDMWAHLTGSLQAIFQVDNPVYDNLRGVWMGVTRRWFGHLMKMAEFNTVLLETPCFCVALLTDVHQNPYHESLLPRDASVQCYICSGTISYPLSFGVVARHERLVFPAPRLDDLPQQLKFFCTNCRRKPKKQDF